MVGRRLSLVMASYPTSLVGDFSVLRKVSDEHGMSVIRLLKRPLHNSRAILSIMLSRGRHRIAPERYILD